MRKVDLESGLDIIARAHGLYGSCRDYLAHTIDGMAALGVCDPD